MPTHKPLHDYADLIRADWQMPYFGARPYIQAMTELNQITDRYYDDSAKSVVLHFLSNAHSWRGPVARQIKSELKKISK